MQIYQPLEPDDFLLIDRMPVKPTKDTYRSFCASFGKPEYVGACLREAWPFFAQEVKTGAGIREFCGGQPNKAETVACYESSFALLGRFSLANPEQMQSTCTDTTEEYRPMCYVFGARTILEEDREDGQAAISFCKNAPAAYVNGCLTTLVQQARFVFGNADRYGVFCKLVPQEFQRYCAP